MQPNLRSSLKKYSQLANCFTSMHCSIPISFNVPLCLVEKSAGLFCPSSMWMLGLIKLLPKNNQKTILIPSAI
ncbi:hypothetical protein BDU57DRAFT_524880 [Ampelomyces quisqualis]|uniref:Uncharacterized protein n=1 Tax=Ampelomyces quisqualis TaxID=50730 RepID=A0A6A5Q8T1_AMPQU|nr:hypothetical protein BDU57DRAFT_524880 [Ampelomyces quisqualis]